MLLGTATIVTVCGVPQLEVEKDKDVGVTVAIVVEVLITGMVTSAVGSVFSTTVKVVVPPASAMVKEDGALMVTPAVSSSWEITVRVSPNGRPP